MKHAAGQADSGREAGFALVAVLWFLLLVAAVVAPFAVAARTDFLIASNTRDQTRLDALADGLSTLLALKATGEEGASLLAELPPNSTPATCTAGRYTVVMQLQDQTGLVDLNAADEATLAIGLRSIGVAQGVADAAAEMIVRYRSYQSETSIMRSDEVAGGLKGQSFESVVELSDLKQLANLEPADLHRAFTVHSGQSGVAASLSPEPLANLLKLPADATPSRSSLSSFAVEVSVRDRTTAIKGYAGFLTQPSEPPNPPFKRIEPLFEASFKGQQSGSPLPCPASLQRDITQLLAGDTG